MRNVTIADALRSIDLKPSMDRRSKHLEVIGIGADDNVMPPQGPFHYGRVDNISCASARHQRADQASLSVVEWLDVAADQ